MKENANPDAAVRVTKSEPHIVAACCYMSENTCDVTDNATVPDVTHDVADEMRSPWNLKIRDFSDKDFESDP